MVHANKHKQQRKTEDKVMMNEKSFMRVEEVAATLDVSKSYAYKIVQKLNSELKAKGYITISGRVSRQYFMEKVCYGGEVDRAYHDSSGE